MKSRPFSFGFISLTLLITLIITYSSPTLAGERLEGSYLLTRTVNTHQSEEGHSVSFKSMPGLPTGAKLTIPAKWSEDAVYCLSNVVTNVKKPTGTGGPPGKIVNHGTIDFKEYSRKEMPRVVGWTSIL